ncbi:MAG: transketolase, partial [Planctomycetes bacterium]|nr:transketolase [Planctomycetota bacterium]
GAIIARTIKGWGVDSIIGLNYHGKPIPPKDLDKVCAELDATGVKLRAKPGKMVLRASPPPASPRSPGEAKAIALPRIEQALKRAGFDDALRDKKLATRAAYGAALVALGDRDERVVALDGDVSNSTFANLFAKEHPGRFFECKIAEQNMISAAAGLAATGKIPFASSFGKFLARAVDQIDLASITRANIKIVGSHSGVSLAADGPSQMSLSDMAYFRSMTRVDSGRGGRLCHVFHPSDAVCAYRCVELMANIEGLCYLRTHRPNAKFLYPLDERFEVGGCKQLRTGRHLTLVGSGYMVYSVLSAAEKLAAEGIECDVFDVYSLPLDAAPILDAARGNNAAILTVEDNYLGGVHAELAEAAAETGGVRVIGVTALRMPKSARTAEEVFSHVGVSEAYILEKARGLAAG